MRRGLRPRRERKAGASLSHHKCRAIVVAPTLPTCQGGRMGYRGCPQLYFLHRTAPFLPHCGITILLPQFISSARKGLDPRAEVCDNSGVGAARLPPPEREAPAQWLRSRKSPHPSRKSTATRTPPQRIPASQSGNGSTTTASP